jgi:dolichol-phosphate mannosyltransferase
MTPILVMVPTYNECDNVEIIADRIRRSVPSANLLFIDDNSPDGTGRILDKLALTDSQILVTHRPRKMGIGSAHLHAIFKAYSENYAILVTLDADLTHSPENINNMILSLNSADVATSSRFLNRSDLDGWNLRRKATTHLGHLLTKVLLGLPYDSSSGFRAYNLANIPERCFELVRNSGYSFFFESLKILDLNKVAIVDVPMNLPPRTYGSSKMKLKDIISSVKILVTFAYETKVNKEKFIS